jgi:hypothetical protein
MLNSASPADGKLRYSETRCGVRKLPSRVGCRSYMGGAAAGLFPELRGCRRQQQVHKDNEPGWGSMGVQQERVKGQSPLSGGL